MRRLTGFGLAEHNVHERTHIVAPRGEIDAVTAPQLGRRLLGLAEVGGKAVLVDLSRVTFMDSTGIGVLLNAHRQLTSRSGQLALLCPTERTRQPFEITGLTGRISIFRTHEEALAVLGAQGSLEASGVS